MQEIPSDSGDADTLVLVPRKVANVMSLSTESISDASIDELDAVGNAMVKGVAVQVDAAAFSSNAETPTTPAGLLSYVLPGAAGPVDIDQIITAVGAIGGHGGVADVCFLNPQDLTALRLTKTTINSYVLAPDAADVEGEPSVRVAGCQLLPTNGLPAGTALVAEARYLQVAIRRDATVDFSGDAAFTSDSIVARVTMRLDWNLGDPHAFYVIGAAGGTAQKAASKRASTRETAD
jgi:HK97 family phage major capsid protein